MKTARLAWWLVQITVLFTAGCINQTSAPRKPTFAVTVTVQGVRPSPEQRRAAVAQYLPTMQARGWVLVQDGSLADEILHLNFVPDPLDPQHKGQVTLLGVTRHVKPRPTTYAGSGYAYRTPPRGTYDLWGPGYYQDRGAYYPYDYGYSSGSGYTSTQPTTPPHPTTPPSTTPPPANNSTYHKPNPHSTNYQPRILPQNDSSASYSPPSYSGSSSSSDFGSSSSSSSGSSSSFSSSSSSDSSFSASSSSSSSDSGGAHYSSNTGRSLEK